MAEHTPTPWRLRTEGNLGSAIEAQSGKRYSELDDGYRIVCSYQECCASDIHAVLEANRKANGEFIVKAVNNHEALVSLLSECLRDYSHPNFTDRRGMADRIRHVLADVGGEKL